MQTGLNGQKEYAKGPIVQTAADIHPILGGLVDGAEDVVANVRAMEGIGYIAGNLPGTGSSAIESSSATVNTLTDAQKK